jgi:hypothetical protein
MLSSSPASRLIGRLFSGTNAASVFRIHKFLGLPDPDLFVRGTDPVLPSSSKIEETPDFHCFVTSFLTFYLGRLM